MRVIIMFFFVSFLSIHAQGQVKKILHQYFEIEEIDNVKLDLAGTFEIVSWAGNSILIETSIELYSASGDIYNFLKEDGRYDIKADSTDNLIRLESVDKERKPIKTKKGECFEIVTVRILIPEDFKIVDQNTLVRSKSIRENSDQ